MIKYYNIYLFKAILYLIKFHFYSTFLSYSVKCSEQAYLSGSLINGEGTKSIGLFQLNFFLFYRWQNLFHERNCQ